MVKNREIGKHIIFIPVAIVVILVIFASLSPTKIGDLPFDQRAWAQASASSNTNTPAPIVQQGIVTSSTDPLPGHEAHQSATILRLRDDNAVYSGVLTLQLINL